MSIGKGEWSPKSLYDACPTYLCRLLISSIVWMLGSVVAAAGQVDSTEETRHHAAAVVVVEQSTVDRSLHAQDDVRTTSFTSRIKS